MISICRNKIKAVLFDLDGTLLDSAPDLAAAANHMRTIRGLEPLPFYQYRPLAGSGAKGMLLAGFGVGPGGQGYEALRAEFLDRYEACMFEQTRPFQDVEILLDTLQRRGLPWAVVTNKAERFAMPLTASLRIFDSATTIVGGDTTPYTKPHPEPLLEAARRLEVDPVACMYVGDDERDIIAGRAAGMLTVAASYGYLGAGADVTRWSAHAEANNPLEVLKFLDMP
jgi:phosphoglycolate phosphatase